MTKIVLFADKRVGFEICKYLSELNEDISRIYIRNSEHEYARKIRNDFQKSTDIFLSDDLRNESHLQELKKIEPDFMITVYWPYLLKPDVFNSSKNGCVNFHPALLPLNRGWYPHVHNILDDSDAGVTLHLIDENADTGPIFVQKKIEVKPDDTAFSLYEELQNEMIQLFKDSWLQIKNGEIRPKVQDETISTYNKKSDINDYIDLNKKYTGRELINILRARSFGNKGFAYFEVKDKKIFLNLRLNQDGNFNY